VLRPELAALIGAERYLARIRTTANLQHPHILPLFDSDSLCGSSRRAAVYLVQEEATSGAIEGVGAV
jgi:hypothetical protein